MPAALKSQFQVTEPKGSLLEQIIRSLTGLSGGHPGLDVGASLIPMISVPRLRGVKLIEKPLYSKYGGGMFKPLSTRPPRAEIKIGKKITDEMDVSRVLDPTERAFIRHHEVGHALVFKEVPTLHRGTIPSARHPRGGKLPPNWDVRAFMTEVLATMYAVAKSGDVARGLKQLGSKGHGSFGIPFPKNLWDITKPRETLINLFSETSVPKKLQRHIMKLPWISKLERVLGK